MRAKPVGTGVSWGFCKMVDAAGGKVKGWGKRRRKTYNVAVKKPRPRVIELERDGQIAISRERSNITTRGIDELEL
jgi:hypothetical protein